MTQRTRLRTMIKAGAGATLMVVLAVAQASVSAPGLFGGSEAAAAQPTYSPAPLRTPPGAAARTPMVRPVPPARVMPKPRLAPNPSTAPGGDTGVIRRGTSSNCLARCGSQCQLVSCSGMNVSQCASVRQQCQSNCRSRC